MAGGVVRVGEVGLPDRRLDVSEGKGNLEVHGRGEDSSGTEDVRAEADAKIGSVHVVEEQPGLADEQVCVAGKKTESRG